MAHVRGSRRPAGVVALMAVTIGLAGCSHAATVAGSSTPVPIESPTVSVSPTASASGASASATASGTSSPSGTPSSARPSTLPSKSASPAPSSSASRSPSSNPPAIDIDGCPRSTGAFITAAPGSGKTVALTFDDGPGPFTGQILAILQSHHIRATFFDTGLHASEYPSLVKAESGAGNLVEDHSYSHTYPASVPGGWALGYVRNQIITTARLLTQDDGHAVCYFRPPGGFTENVLTATRSLDINAVLWSVDSEDWKQPGETTAAATAAIVKQATAVNGQAHPILLMHSSKASHEPNSQVSPFRGNTVAALPTIIEWYQAHGYTFVDLLGRS